MLPFPGSPGASWAMSRERMLSSMRQPASRIATAFFLLGLINNLLYVIILSAAADLVGPSIPKGVVLLADVLPGFTVKLIGPYFVHLVPYSWRICALAAVSASGMFLIATSPTGTGPFALAVKITGIMLASAASGGGELTFLGLSHYYPTYSLPAWGSGTGAAGLVGAGAYSIATSTMGLSSRATLFTFSVLPALLLVGYFGILPPKHAETIATEDEETDADGEEERQGLLSSASPKATPLLDQLKSRLKRAEKLFMPYMLPLLLVYVAEYTINQGVSPTLLFPPAETPFKSLRDFYPAYNAIYQVVNLCVLTLHALLGFIPSVYIIFAIIFWEGLLGGLVYVNTFADITEQVPPDEREFSLSATTVSDSAGILLAAFISMGMETWLCRHQVANGIDLCQRA